MCNYYTDVGVKRKTMFRGLYTSYTGMKVQQRRVEGISNNIANIDTVGFKKDRIIETSFKDVLTTKIRDGKPNKMIGKMTLGVKVDSVYTDFSQGSLKQTDSPLDLALEGKGFFKVGVLNKEGKLEQRYTRDGSFVINEKDELMTKDGFYVLTEDGKKINVGNEPKFTRINKDGSIYVKEDFKGKIAVVNFEDTKELRKEGDSLYTVRKGNEEIPFKGKIVQGFLENSSVNSAEEMIDLITATRIYEANQKVIQTYDDTMEKVANNIGQVK